MEFKEVRYDKPEIKALFTGYTLYCMILEKDESVEYMMRETSAFLKEGCWQDVNPRILVVNGKFYCWFDALVKNPGLYKMAQANHWIQAEEALMKELKKMRRNLK